MKTVLAVLCFVSGLAVAGVAAGQELSFEETLASAEQGNADAQATLGIMYTSGDGVPENDAEGIKWYRLAAEQGLVEAQWLLGIMYTSGDGVPENDAEAVKWFRLAAEQGDVTAQFNLSGKYRNGEGVPQNLMKGYIWESLAAAQGHEDARFNRDISAQRLTPDQLARAQEIATRCFESDYQDCD
jgi:uncharacterized protein